MAAGIADELVDGRHAGSLSDELNTRLGR
jgi:hypothetical protein